MHHGFALRYLAEALEWDEQEEEEETRWLRLISQFKYDNYQDFLVGSRFVESLLNWILQFEREDRRVAYRFVREQLVFISMPEIDRLVRRTYPTFIEPFIVRRAARKAQVPDYLVRSSPQTTEMVSSIAKKTLYLGLSDGAHLDVFRRSNATTVSNEQVVSTYQFDDEKWEDVVKELKKRTDNPESVFEVVVLLDDFTASGASLLRKKDGEWKGKLPRIRKSLEKFQVNLAADFDVFLLHYIGTEAVRENIPVKVDEWGGFPELTTGEVKFSFDMLLSNALRLERGRSGEFEKIIHNYYDPSIKTTHNDEGGTEDIKFGFGDCGLPLVIEHNTPNNSLPILWAESEPQSPDVSPMRPLFRRRERHG